MPLSQPLGLTAAMAPSSTRNLFNSGVNSMRLRRLSRASSRASAVWSAGTVSDFMASSVSSVSRCQSAFSPGL